MVSFGEDACLLHGWTLIISAVKTVNFIQCIETDQHEDWSSKKWNAIYYLSIILKAKS